MPILLALALLAAAPLRALEAVPLQGSAGAHLREVWAQARGKYPDAKLISITSATGAEGRARCSPTAPFQNGWRFTFYSPSADEFAMMGECGGKIAGPLRQLRTRGAEVGMLNISGKFIDSDQAMRTLGRLGVNLKEIDEKTPGKRPFSLSLSRLDDERFKERPIVWKVHAGGETWYVDAVHNEKLNPERYGLDYSVQLASAIANSETLAERPKRDNVYTAKEDLEQALSYARKHYAEAVLMAVEGFVDAWGGSPCTGPGDGWAYYFYNARRRSFEVVFACNGFVGPGPTRNIPVDLAKHDPITSTYVDSDAAVDGLLVTHGDAFHEPMGRRFTQKGTLLLRQYKLPPYKDPTLWKVKTLWELSVGRTRFMMDAVNGRMIDVR